MDRNSMRNISYLSILAVLLVLSFLLLRPVLMSIITGILLASLFVPLYTKIYNKIKSRDLSASIIMVVLLLLIVLPLWFLTPVLLDQSLKVYAATQEIDFVTPLKTIFPSIFSTEQFSNEIGSVLSSFVSKITNSAINMITKVILNFPTLFLQLLVVLFTFFFVVRDHEKLISYIQSVLPFTKETETKLFKSTKDITFSVIYGQVVIGILQGIFAGISFFLFGVENALFLTLIACMAGIFPIIGTSIIWVPVAAFLLVGGAIFPALGVAVFGLLSAFFENGVKPAFVSKRTNVHSGVILVGMIGGLFMFGILGFILGPLILAYLLIVLELFRDKRTPGFFIQPPQDEIDIKMGFF